MRSFRFALVPQGTATGAVEAGTGATKCGAELVTLDSAARAMHGRFARTRLPRFTVWPL